MSFEEMLSCGCGAEKKRRGEKLMSRYFVCGFIAVLLFSGIDCKTSVVGPPSGADTTSHNWTFTIDTLGDGSSGSYLNDVAIVSTDPPLVYTVGQV